MALHSSGKAANVVGSLQKYVNDELADVLNSSQPAIDYGGGFPFQDSELAEWLQVRVLGPSRPATLSGPFAPRTVPGEPRGQELFWVLNVNCFVRPTKLGVFSNLRALTLRDLVLEKFTPGTRIQVTDYAGTGAAVGKLFVDEVLDDRVIPEAGQPDLVQHNLVFALRWAETWVVGS